VTPADGPLVAVLSKRGRFTVAEPVFERGRRVTLDGGRRPGAGVGDLVLLGWGKRGPRVVRSLGRPDVARDVLEGLMLERGLRRAFPRAVEEAATDAAASPPVDAPRRDLTELPTFTIDPVTARDYDDAISARAEDDGRIRVWVHIADVGAYVRPGDAIEREAFRRATSVYVPGAVEPMLPHALSSDACSLVPGADRLAVSVEMLLNGPDVESVAFHRSLIRSDARLTYEQVDRVYAGEERAADPWGEPLALARAAAAALRERRESAGSLEVSSSEPAFEFDERGHVVAVHSEEQTESHSTIEQLMVLANEQVAGWLEDHKKPALYRVHERPDPQAVELLLKKLADLGVPTPPAPEQLSPAAAAEVAAATSERVMEYVAQSGRGREAFPSLVLRSLKQARYHPENLGHSGLASRAYCHFTSPIRRYPDLVVHRALLRELGLSNDVGPADLDELAEHTSAREREAAQVEYLADALCLAWLLDDQLFERGWEQPFDGEIVGLIGSGMFVRFGDVFEGFLPARRLPGDYFELNELGTALVGRRGGGTFRLGDAIDVLVEKIEKTDGKVELSPVGRPRR
jgi:ribonuclease R